MLRISTCSIDPHSNWCHRVEPEPLSHLDRNESNCSIMEELKIAHLATSGLQREDVLSGDSLQQPH